MKKTNIGVVDQGSIALQIHKELNEILEKECIPTLSSEISSIKITEVEPKVEDYTRSLSALGFSNVPVVVSTKEKISDNQDKNTDIITKNRIISLLKEFSSEVYPYKAITMTALHRVMEKYGLFISTPSRFIKNIPTNNLSQINKFTDNKFPKLSKWRNISHNLMSESYTNKRIPSFMVAATSDCFNMDKSLIIGREIVNREAAGNYKLNFNLSMPPTPDFSDPIILCPFKFNRDGFDLILFAIVTAWGKEAKDEEIFNELLN
jgi:hypothetical protein